MTSICSFMCPWISSVLRSGCSGSCHATGQTNPAPAASHRSTNGSDPSDQRISIIRRRIVSRKRPNLWPKVTASWRSTRRTTPSWPRQVTTPFPINCKVNRRRLGTPTFSGKLEDQLGDHKRPENWPGSKNAELWHHQPTHCLTSLEIVAELWCHIGTWSAKCVCLLFGSAQPNSLNLVFFLCTLVYHIAKKSYT